VSLPFSLPVHPSGRQPWQLPSLTLQQYEAKTPTLFVSLEMSDESIVRRMVATVGSVPMQDIKTGEMSEGSFKSMGAASAKIAQSPLHFASGSQVSNIASITALIRRSVRKWGIKLVIIDYLTKDPRHQSSRETYLRDRGSLRQAQEHCRRYERRHRRIGPN